MCRQSSRLFKDSHSIFAATMYIYNLAGNVTKIMKFPGPNLINGCLWSLHELAIFSTPMNCENGKISKTQIWSQQNSQ